MKAFALLLVASFLLASCDRRTKEEKAMAVARALAYPSIVVTPDRDPKEPEKGQKPPVYSIPPSKGLIIDTTTYHPKFPPDVIITDYNCVRIRLHKYQDYWAEIDPSKPLNVVDSTTLRARGESPPVFTGMQAGQSWSIDIGNCKPDGSLFESAWGGEIEVSNKP